MTKWNPSVTGWRHCRNARRVEYAPGDQTVREHGATLDSAGISLSGVSELVLRGDKRPHRFSDAVTLPSPADAQRVNDHEARPPSLAASGT
jgi:hypothetical protein